MPSLGSARRTSRHSGPTVITPSTTYLSSRLSNFSLCVLPRLQSFSLSHPKSLLFLSPFLKVSQALIFTVLVMEGGLGLLGVGSGGGGGGGLSGASSNESTLSKVEVVSEVTSYSDEAELELGLGLSIGGCRGKAKAAGGAGWGECGRILTAKDFPSVVSHRANNDGDPSSAVAVSGTKRTADSVSHEGGSPTSASQVVGWPPIRAYRMNSLVSQAKAPRAEEDKSIGGKDKSKDGLKKKVCDGTKICSTVNEKGNLGFIKVNMDGVPIGRKVDLNAHACYETLAQALETMFFKSSPAISGIGKDKDQAAKPSKLLDGSSEYVLTYEDKEGDWMLVGDVPWRMFLSSVRRLRIMRTAEANGLAPRVHEGNERLKAKPI